MMATPPGTPGADNSDPRVAWANATRLAVTRPDALNANDGSLNQQFFKPKKVVFATEKAKWGHADWQNLYKGIEKFGIDPSSWRKIIDTYCPNREVLFIRIKASRAIGSQGLNRYHGKYFPITTFRRLIHIRLTFLLFQSGWIGNKADVLAEYERNKQIGLATGCWKGGILVENDHKHAEAAIKKRDAEEAAAGVEPPGKRIKLH